METRKCSKCGEEKLLNKEYFHSWGAHGFHRRCKPCRNEDNQIYRDTPEAKRKAKETNAKWFKEWYKSPKNRAKVKVHSKKFRKENPLYAQEHYLANLDYYGLKSRRNLLKKYGLTVEEYKALVHKQQGKCRICGKVLELKNLVVDHDHATKLVRGLLCFSCNVALGLFQEKLDNLKNAVKYMKGFYDKHDLYQH